MNTYFDPNGAQLDGDEEEFRRLNSSDDGGPEAPTFTEETFAPAPAWVSPWVRRAQDNDLPTFDRHNGAMAYARP